VAFEELAVRLGLALHQVGEAGRDGIDLVVKGLVVARSEFWSSAANRSKADRSVARGTSTERSVMSGESPPAPR
jgi:hypothetical protein